MIVKCRELGLTNFKIALRQQFINIILIRKYTIPLIITLCCVSNAYYNWVYLRRCFKPVQNECSHSANTTPTHTLASICTQRAVQMLFVCDFCFIAFWNSNYLYLECKDWQRLHGPVYMYRRQHVASRVHVYVKNVYDFVTWRKLSKCCLSLVIHNSTNFPPFYMVHDVLNYSRYTEFTY